MCAQQSAVSTWDILLGIRPGPVLIKTNRDIPSKTNISKSIPRRERTRISAEQRNAIKHEIGKKILEGKFAAKVIHDELITDGLVSADLSGTSPNLKRSAIAEYIKDIRRSMKIKLPIARDRIVRLYKKMMRYGYRRSRIINEISAETGCGREYVRQVIKMHEA